MERKSTVGVAMLVKFESGLPDEEMRRRYPERMPQFRALSGLVQKYYFQDPATGEWGGLYLWDSEESMRAYLDSDLRKSIGAAYEVQGAPRIEVLSVVDRLRD